MRASRVELERHLRRYLDPQKHFYSKRCKRGECHEWRAKTRPSISVMKVFFRASHIAWFLRYGKLPKLNLLHTCDNELCVRVEHLFEGSTLDNVRNMYAKGREAHKISPDDVRDIRFIYRRIMASTRRLLASQYDVTHQAIKRIINREVRPEVEDYPGHTKLTGRETLMLLRMAANGASYKALAGRFDLHPVTISAIIKAQTK